jgi:hypothetical protein
MRRPVFVATLLLAVGVAFYFWPRSKPSAGSPATKSAVEPAATSGPTRQSPSATPAGKADSAASRVTAAANSSSAASNSDADFPIAAPLNAPNSNIARDLDIVRQIFETWQSNFPREGNPVGENAEITTALMGENRLGLALIPKGHRAVNAQGELCDRWGTPFRFHQLSGTKMEIRSAGPDRKFATDDDATWTPP